MFLALPLFHLVLESSQPRDCEEFLASLNERRGVIGCRFWTCTDFRKTYMNYTGLFVFSGSFGSFERGIMFNSGQKQCDFPGD